MTFTFTALLLAAMLLPRITQANGDDGSYAVHATHGGHGTHGAHVHGVAELLLTRDGRQLELVLESPAANLVGFEHPPTSAGDREAIDRAVESLLNGEQLFTIVGGDCIAVGVQLINPFDDAYHPRLHDHRSGSTEHSESHTEFHISYQYRCTAKAGIRELKADLLAVFPAIGQLDVQWITESGQGAGRLSADNDTVRLQ
ncbi:MAG TPA: DUF2796 domain-containing protein [Kineobactrum sp.]